MTDRPPNVHVSSHPLVAHKLSWLRDRTTGITRFRALINELGMLLAYEATRDLPLATARIQTPLEPMDTPVLEGKKLVIVPVLRAGLALLDGFLAVVPHARIGHIGLARNPVTLEPQEYLVRLPTGMRERDCLVVDPMLATGHSATAALDRVAREKPRSLRLVCLLAAPEGIACVQRHHPAVPIYTAAIDRQLNDHGYILPGLGDAGDRMFGTE